MERTGGDLRSPTLKHIFWPLRYNSWRDGDGKKEDMNRNMVIGTAPSLKAAYHLEMGLPSMPQAAPTGTLLRKVWGGVTEDSGDRGGVTIHSNMEQP